MSTAVIVQARMTSTRLPGKVMFSLGDKTVLGQVLMRCQQIQGVDIICCAIPSGAEHDILVEESKKYGAIVFRGAETNVLERYYEAAKFIKADVIMRITSDCPLINSEVCSQVLHSHFINNAQYTCNNMPPTWPHGYDCEVFGFHELEQAMLHSSEPDDFEHVTEWMRRTYSVNNVVNPNGNEHHLRVTLDTQEDYMFINNIFMKSFLVD